MHGRESRLSQTHRVVRWLQEGRVTKTDYMDDNMQVFHFRDTQTTQPV